MPNVYEVQPTNENGDLVSLVTRTSTIYDNNGNPIGGFATENELCEAYEPTKTYPTYSKYCIYNNAFYKYTGTGTSTGAFDSTKWTLTNFAEVGQTLMGTDDISAIGDGTVTGALTTLNSTLAGFVHKKFVSGTTDSSGRLFPDYSIAYKVVVGLLPDEHGKIAQQFRLSSNKLGIRVLNSDAMTAYANSNIGVNVFYISMDYVKNDDSN